MFPDTKKRKEPAFGPYIRFVRGEYQVTERALRSHGFRVRSCTNRPPLAPTFRIALGGDMGPRFRLRNPGVAGLVFDGGSRARKPVSSLGFRFGCLWRIFLDVVETDMNSITAGPRFRFPNPGVAGLGFAGGSSARQPVSSA